MPRNVVVINPAGFIFQTAPDDWNRSAIYKGQYDRSLLQLLSRGNPSSLIIDVGANFGVALHAALRNSTVNCKFLAIEPQSSCCVALREFSKHYNRDGKVLQVAAGGGRSKQKLFGSTNPNQSGGASILSHANTKEDGVDIEIDSLENILRKENLDNIPISILKIDTEGYEANVLAGMQNLLRLNPPEILIIEVSPNFGDISYLEKLWEILPSKFCYFELAEVGLIRRKLKLYPIDLPTALNLQRQINLVAYQSNVMLKSTKK